MSDDLNRVQADLAVMRGVCAEPALPIEEVRGSLALAALFSALAVASWWGVPVAWVKLGTLLSLAGLIGFFLPRKLRVLKGNPASRRLERKEQVIWGVVCAVITAYFLFRRWMFPNYTDMLWRQDGGAALFFMGVGVLANALVHPTRRGAIAPATVAMVGGLVAQWAPSVAAAHLIFPVTAAVYCLAYAAGLTWQARHQLREQHVGH